MQTLSTQEHSGLLENGFGVPGIDNFYAEVDAQIQSLSELLESLVLINIEVDNLEFILRNFGPVVRDELIKSICELISTSIPEETRLYHINQFRFAVVAVNMPFDKVTKLTEQLVESLEHAITIGTNILHAEIKIGISQFPNNADNIHELVRKAAFASYLAKMEKTDYAIYNQEKDDWEKHQFRLLTDFRAALDNKGELNCALQPVICLDTGACISVESLIRWNHSELGNVPPNHFLPYVEQSALIMPFTEITIASSLQLHTYFAKKGYGGTISINLSTMVFRISKLFSRISELISFYNVKSENICFEITETSIMEHPKASIYLLNQLRELGCKISIDDFGTGHSSLAYLADLPIDIIKIDQYFIKDIERKSNKAIIDTTATLADKLGFKTVAEGIETESQLNICKELGVNYGQGYYFAKPLMKQSFERWLKNKHSATLRLV